MTNRKGTRTVKVRVSVDIDVEVQVTKDNETTIVGADIVGGDITEKAKRMNPPMEFIQMSCLDEGVIAELAIEAAMCADYDDAELFEADVAGDQEREGLQ